MKIFRIKSIYRQIIFTIVAFSIMVALSYLFNSRTVRANLSKNADSMLSFTQEQIESKLIASKMMLGTFAQTVRMMIIDGQIKNIQHYTNVVSEYAVSKELGLFNVNGIFGYFEGVFEEDVYIDGTGWEPPDDYVPTERIWYKKAIQNCGKIIETEPYIDATTGQLIISYACCIHNADDIRMGVICIDVLLEGIGGIVDNAALNEGGYGILIAQDLSVITYINRDFIGRRINEPGLSLARFADKISRGEGLYEQRLRNWRGEKVIAFSRQFPNGWHLVLLSPEDQYYKGTTQMLIVLCLLGAILAGALITFLARIERAKIKADEESKQKSAFLANMSHEIRTPMNAIIGMTFIGKSADDIPRKNYCLDKIENASQHLLGVINDILDMSKIEANMFELSYVDFNFETMIQRVVNIISFRVDEKKQKLNVYIDKSIPRSLIGDDQRLAQVITNLLSNAVKFTPEGGSITLDTRFVSEEDGVFTIRGTVKDSGIGITAEQQKQLFQSFQQADSGTSRKFGGTGLGLAISKNIIEMMGGTIELDSEIGKGSSFSFTFKAKHGDKKGVNLSEVGVNWENVTIMAVDDDKEILDYFKDVVQGFGTNCDTALSGNDALSQIENNGLHHIYFIDWKMPDMDGISLAKEIKAKSKFPNDAVIIMISAAEWSSIAEEAKKAGIDRFLSKPLFASSIADAIAEVIGVREIPKDETKTYEGIFEGFKILLAEDVEINQEIIDTLIEPTLLKMDCAMNGLEAVSLFNKSPDDYDLILMDVQMPEMDGYEATEIIRTSKHAKAAAVPIIAMTANVFKEDIEKCLAAGMNGHIGKPIDVNEFFTVLQKYLKK